MDFIVACSVGSPFLHTSNLCLVILTRFPVSIIPFPSEHHPSSLNYNTLSTIPSVDQAIDRTIDQLISRSISQSMNQSITRLMDLGSGLQICPYYARCIHQFTYRGSTKENDSRHCLITPRPPRVKHKAVAVRNVPLVHFYFLFRPCPKPNAGPKPNADPKPLQRQYNGKRPAYDKGGDFWADSIGL